MPTISASDLDLFTVTDDPQTAVDTIIAHYEQHGTTDRVPPTAEEMRRHPQERMTAEGTIYGVPPLGRHAARRPPATGA